MQWFFHFYPNYRAIDLNGLVGYIGAYIGLFLGYSILQMPELILLLSRNVKKYFNKTEVSVTNTLSRTQEILVKQILSNNISIETTTKLDEQQLELGKIPGKSNGFPQENRREISRKVDKFCNELREEIEVLKTKIDVLEKQKK